MHNRNFGGELGEKGGFLHRAIAPTNYDEFFSSEEESIAQVAQVETPWPVSRFSFGSPIGIADAPVAMMTVFVSTVRSPSIVSVNGRCLKFTTDTSPVKIPHRSVLLAPAYPSSTPGP